MGAIWQPTLHMLTAHLFSAIPRPQETERVQKGTRKVEGLKCWVF